MNEKVKLILETMMKGKWRAPAGELIGYKLVDYGEGRAIFSMRADKRHHNPMGGVHGGILCDIADAAMGIAFVTTLNENENFTTINLQINYLRAIEEGDLVAEGIVNKRGKTIGYVECNVKDSEDNLIAAAQGTCMVLREKPIKEY
ncbi:MAG: PaaI family thioesterase [Candidatus Kariarchaeaceae archaeon]|jgi:uncharacterized protein (TIGR00369 family)